jgi:hypothetical protein
MKFKKLRRKRRDAAGAAVGEQAFQALQHLPDTRQAVAMSQLVVNSAFDHFSGSCHLSNPVPATCCTTIRVATFSAAAACSRM